MLLVRNLYATGNVIVNDESHVRGVSVSEAQVMPVATSAAVIESSGI